MVIAFLDASALIYLIEGKEPFSGKVRRQLQRLVKAEPDLRTAVSRLTWLECRVGPMKDNDADTLAAYDAFLSRPDLICVDLSGIVIDLATAIRARTGLESPDALQAASCLQLGKSHVFLTGDSGFKRVAGLNVRRLSG